MLISFTTENLLSFRDEITLDMTATAIKAHSYSLLSAGRHKVLPVISIYGANASGKSNLIQSIDNMFNCITGHRNTLPPFAFFAETEDNPISRMNICFTLKIDNDWTECRYSLNINELNKFVKEELFATTKKELSIIFSREWDDTNNTWILKSGSSKMAKSMTKEIEYVSNMESKQDRLLITALGIRGKHTLFEKIYAWANNTVLYSSIYRPMRTGRFIRDTDNIYNFMENEETNDALRDFIHDVNPTIYKITREKEVLQRNSREDINRYRLIFDYCLNGRETDESLRWITRYESEGVWTALHLFPDIYNALQNGGLLLIDELENSLHPLLMANIINLFTSPETNLGGGQLIFTTHNALLMDKKYFRQDEILFVEKDSGGCSTIYNLSDIEGVRSDLDFCKNYILGAFGAVPDFSGQTGGGSQ